MQRYFEERTVVLDLKGRIGTNLPGGVEKNPAIFLTGYHYQTTQLADHSGHAV
jgi:hypothetical protein